MEWDDGTRAARVEGELLRKNLVQVVDPNCAAEVTAWKSCDLASMIEGCFHLRIDPSSLDEAAYAGWLERLAESYEPPDPSIDRAFLRYLWLLDDGEPAGTLALPHSAFGRLDLPLWSLYVHPSRRRRGIASRTLRAAHEAARAASMRGIRVDTHWAWQRSVRFYLAQGMWVVSWKRAIGFSWLDDHPPYEIEEQDDHVALVVKVGGVRMRWLSASRDGDRLVLEQDEGLSARFGAVHAHSTMAVVLATRGFPLVRSKAWWEKRHGSADIGHVEGFASKIQVFEALAHYWGWDVSTPRIPGLAYPPLGELE